jgi:hypothetical protein
MLVILTPWEAEIGRISDQGQADQKVRHPPISTNKILAWWYVPVIPICRSINRRFAVQVGPGINVRTY